MLRQHFTAFIMIMCAIAAFGTETDNEGYPVLYLRCSSGSQPWTADQSRRFTRNGDLYSIYITELDGEFKIASDDWAYSYGSNTGTTCHIRQSTTVIGHKSGGGENFVASGLRDVDIWFVLQPNSADTGISFNVGSVKQPTSNTLPVIYIDVTDDAGNYNDEIIDRNLAHKEYFNATYYLDINGCKWLEDLGAKSIGSADAPLPMQIKARGNWSRTGFSKKPYKLKLDKKQELLGMSKSKHYTLLAHADDNWGFMRNITAFELGRYIGLPWTPRQQPVEVVINGDYRGLYFLTEAIRVDPDRIDIREQADNETDPTLASGGYIVELDNYDEPEHQIQMPEKSNLYGTMTRKLMITFEAPEVYSPLQERFVREQFEFMNDAVGEASDNLWRAIDLDDAVRYYLVEELVGDREAYQGSTFIFRDHGEEQKWHFSPLWDFGHAFESGHDRIFNTTLFGCTWLASFWQNKMFRAKTLATWKWFMGSCYNELYTTLEAYAEHIAAAAKADHRRWVNIDAPSGGIPVATNPDMTERHIAVKTYMQDRVAWLATILGTTGIVEAEPERDATPALPLPEYISGFQNVSIGRDADESAVRYYTLMGMQISGPASNGIYIERRGSKVRKILR